EAYVKSAKKFNKPELLNVEHVIAGNKLFLNLIEEKKINYCKIYRVVCNWLKMKAKSLKT
ncbi:MAG: hypothetical protein QXP04_03590, partial [Candidatus Nanoarchaeia archaeon]|nr:hypothetical protein [Candidatus Jingweiarchaeum tengchongense]